MKQNYRLGEDFFIASGFLFIAAAVITKLFNVSFDLGLTTVSASGFLWLGGISLLFSIALNIQEMARK